MSNNVAGSSTEQPVTPPGLVEQVPWGDDEDIQLRLSIRNFVTYNQYVTSDTFYLWNVNLFRNWARSFLPMFECEQLFNLGVCGRNIVEFLTDEWSVENTKQISSLTHYLLRVHVKLLVEEGRVRRAEEARKTRTPAQIAAQLDEERRLKEHDKVYNPQRRMKVYLCTYETEDHWKARQMPKLHVELDERATKPGDCLHELMEKARLLVPELELKNAIEKLLEQHKANGEPSTS